MFIMYRKFLNGEYQGLIQAALYTAIQLPALKEANILKQIKNINLDYLDIPKYTSQDMANKSL